MRMYTATEERRDPPAVIRLRPVPRCDPPFDDELPSDAAVSADQLTFPWPRVVRVTVGLPARLITSMLSMTSWRLEWLRIVTSFQLLRKVKVPQ